MLGNVCTCSYRFCDVKHGQPEALDWLVSERVPQAVKAMKLKHAVITSVNCDEEKDEGAPIFAAVNHRIRELLPGCAVEIFIPDFKRSIEALTIVMDARPEILNHNVETVPSLFTKVQLQDHYEGFELTLHNAKYFDPEVLTKSGIVVGLGETMDGIKAVMHDLQNWGSILTVGQYLQPSLGSRLPSLVITRWKNLQS